MLLSLTSVQLAARQQAWHVGMVGEVDEDAVLVKLQHAQLHRADNPTDRDHVLLLTVDTVPVGI
jgi:hypothetical protein